LDSNGNTGHVQFKVFSNLPQSICLPACLSVCLSVGLCNCAAIASRNKICLSASLCLSVYLPVHLSICRPMQLWSHSQQKQNLSVCLSVCLPVCLSVCNCATIAIRNKIPLTSTAVPLKCLPSNKLTQTAPMHHADCLISINCHNRPTAIKAN